MKKIILMIFLFATTVGFSQSPSGYRIMVIITRSSNGSFLTSLSNYSASISTGQGNELFYVQGTGAVNEKYVKYFDLTVNDFPLTLYAIGTSYIQNGTSQIQYCSGYQTVPNYNLVSYNDGAEASVYGCGVGGITVYSPNRLKIPVAETTKGVCDNISLTGGTTYFYSKDGITWSKIPQPVGSTTLNFVPKDIPNLGPTFSGNLFINADFTISPLYSNTNPFTPITDGTIRTNTVTYNIIPCSPALATNPETTLTKCDDSSDGSVKLTFASQIADDQKLLIVLFTGTSVPPIVTSKSVLKSELINNTFTWTNLEKGPYSIKYQAQKSNDNSTSFVSSAIDTPPFTITSPQPLTFSAVAINPNCYDGMGQITINASGGTPPYYYSVNNQEVQFASPITIPASTGDTIIKVRDTNSCIDKTAND